jgi:hypothetical protein
MHVTLKLCKDLTIQTSLPVLDELITEGHRIKTLLEDWHRLAISWQTTRSAHKTSHLDSQMVIAMIYYHTTLIFLSGIFDYHEQFDHVTEPKLTKIEVQRNVSDILILSTAALKKTNLAGILFFYPLRVAGARAKTTEQKSSILAMLEDVSLRNFVVADAFLHDLTQLWASQER